MASIVMRGESYSVVYMNTVDGARKQSGKPILLWKRLKSV